MAAASEGRGRGRSDTRSVLIHPNTGHTTGDHTTRATWLGPKIELDIDPLRREDEKNGVAPD